MPYRAKHPCMLPLRPTSYMATAVLVASSVPPLLSHFAGGLQERGQNATGAHVVLWSHTGSSVGTALGAGCGVHCSAHLVNQHVSYVFIIFCTKSSKPRSGLSSRNRHHDDKRVRLCMWTIWFTGYRSSMQQPYSTANCTQICMCGAYCGDKRGCCVHLPAIRGMV